VLAQYNSVNSAADQTAQTPFQSYGGQFVAPVNGEQSTGIANTNTAAGEAQPYYGAATSTLGSAQAGVNPVNSAAEGLAGASAEQVNATPLTGSDINQYLSPYLSDVMGSTEALQNQSNQQQQAGQLGTAISSGAFGGDRTGLAAANLEQQQNLGNSSTLANIANTGYTNAQGVAQQQQGVNLAAGQANRAALGSAGSELASIGSTAYGEGANTASELGSLGSGAQAAGLSGASAQIAAGTVQQQTQQAQDTAEYNQFLQQESYPFQVDQFLANIAEGTGALSGSTTTTTQPGGFFSDRRLKYDLKRIGKTYDGQAIYSYKMHGDPRTHIGLIAQSVEKKHPHAVGLAAGYKTVDYGKATDDSAKRGHFAGGGSIVSDADLQAILQAQQNMYAPMSGGSAAYGQAPGSVPRGGSSRVPAPSGATPHLVTASGGLKQQPTGIQNMQALTGLVNSGQQIYKGVSGSQKPAAPQQGPPAPSQGLAGPAAADPNNYGPPANDASSAPDASGLAAAAPTPDLSDLSSMESSDMSMGDMGDAMSAMDANRGGRMKRYAMGGAPAMGGTQRMQPMNMGLAGGQQGAQPMSVGLSRGLPQQGMGQRFRRGGFAGGGGPYSNDVGAGSTTLGIPTASGPSEMRSGLSAAAPPAQTSSDPLAGLDQDDPAMQGIMASTQGQIKFDDGGAVPDYVPNAPDSNVPQSMNIPNDPGASAAKAPTAAAPPAGPSAGQQDFQDIAQIAGIVAMCCAKRGGRIGKDDGGALSDDADPNADPDMSPVTIDPRDQKLGLAAGSDDLSPVTTSATKIGLAGANTAGGDQTLPDLNADVPTSKFAGTADTAPVTYQGGVSPSSAPVTPPGAENVPINKPTTWEKISTGLHAAGLDKAANVVPLLQGLAAMGMAPTKHLGVALAAGINAGASAYLPAQAESAQIQGQQIQNQRAQFQLDTLKAPLPTSGAGGPPPEPTFAGTGADPSNIIANAQKQYAVRDIWTPSEQASLQQNQQWQRAGLPNSLASIQAAHTARIQNLTTANQQGASATYQAAYAAANAPAGAALSKVREIDPTAADQIQSMAQSPEDADSLARTWAGSTGNAVHQWSGRGQTTGKDGVQRDTPSQQPMLGASPEGVSADQQAQNLIRLHGTTVDTGANAHPTPAALSGNTLSPGTRPVAPGSPGSTPPGTAGAPTAPAGPAAPTLRAKAATKANVPAGSSLDFSGAQNAPAYATNPNMVLTDAQKPLAKTYGEAEAALKAEANQLPQTEQSVIKAQRSLNLLPYAKTGPGTDTMSAMQTALGNMTGSQFVSWLDSNPSAHALLQKQLGTNALDTTLKNLREDGAQVRLGQQESGLIINKLSASTDMPKTAISSLLQWQIQQGNYDMAREAAIPSYLAHGKDATLFDNFYAAPGQHPLSSVLTTGAPTGTTIANPMPMGPKLQAYATAHFGGDVGKAQSYLKTKGYQ
jgi:hypothetical protein